MVILVIVLFTVSCSSEKEEPQASAEMNLQLLGITSQLNSIKGDISTLQNQLEDIEDSIGEKTNDESPEIEATNRLLNEVLDELEELRDIESYNHERISFLEKELIKQTSGAYDNYNFYYYEGDYSRYSVRFSKDYYYETDDLIPAEEDHEEVPAAFRIFLDKDSNEFISLHLWHSFGVSTTMKDIPVKYMYTDEGEVIEYVDYEIDGINYIDFGFEDYFLKISCHFNEDNTMDTRKKVMDIVKTIIFYEFNFEKYDYQK